MQGILKEHTMRLSENPREIKKFQGCAEANLGVFRKLLYIQCILGEIEGYVRTVKNAYQGTLERNQVLFTIV